MSQLADSTIARQFDRLPPHSIEAEMCLLASMMLDKEMIGQVVQIVDREAFYQADHQIIFDILVKLYEQNRPIDAVILREELIKRQLLEEVGGTAYLAQILNIRPLGRPRRALRRRSSARKRCCASSSPPATTSFATPMRRTSRPTSCSTRPRRRIFEIAQKKVGGAMVADGGRAARSLRDDRRTAASAASRPASSSSTTCSTACRTAR